MLFHTKYYNEFLQGVQFVAKLSTSLSLNINTVGELDYPNKQSSELEYKAKRIGIQSKKPTQDFRIPSYSA